MVAKVFSPKRGRHRPQFGVGGAAYHRYSKDYVAAGGIHALGSGRDATAGDVSIARTRACGWGLRGVAPQTMFSWCMSDANAIVPVTCGMPSGLLALEPTLSNTSAGRRMPTV